jgi:hypothetical protein
MSEFASLFRQFLYRDLAFVLGGLVVLGSLAYAFRSWTSLIGWISSNWHQLSPASIVVIVAASYVIGYAVQDIGGVLGITTTHPFEPGCFCKWLYERFSGFPWREITYYDVRNDREFKFEIHMGRLQIPETTILQALERIRALKVISMCMGGCLAVSAFILLVQIRFNEWSLAVDISILILLSLFAFCLICLGWIKGMQEMQFYQSIYDEGFPIYDEGFPKKDAAL